MRHRLAAGALALTTATSTIVTGSSTAAITAVVTGHATSDVGSSAAPTATALGYVLVDYRRQLRLAAAEAARMAHMSRAQRRAALRAHHRAAVAAAKVWKAELRATEQRLARAAARKAALYTPSYVWAHRPFSVRVANCESGGGPRDHSSVYDGNPYLRDPNGHYGKWQFDFGTWREVGGTGNPADASIKEQDRRGYLLWRENGWSRWQCAGMVG